MEGSSLKEEIRANVSVLLHIQHKSHRAGLCYLASECKLVRPLAHISSELQLLRVQSGPGAMGMSGGSYPY